MLFETFIMSQFNYCPLVWMCYSRSLKNKMNNIHNRALGIVHHDKKIKFTGFTTEGQICVYPHEKLAIFSYIVKNCLSPKIMKEVFILQENKNYNMRSGRHLTNRNTYSAFWK